MSAAVSAPSERAARVSVSVGRQVADVTVRRLQSYVRNKNFRPEAVEQVSKAARSLCVWVLAVDQYAKVASNVSFRAGTGPKQLPTATCN